MNQTGWCKPANSAETHINGIARFVVCAANRYGDEVVIGVRHSCPLMTGNLNRLGAKSERKVLMADGELNVITCQGFVDQWGNWMSRAEAFNLVKATGQHINWERNGCTKTLYSEGLYDVGSEE